MNEDKLTACKDSLVCRSFSCTMCCWAMATWLCWGYELFRERRTDRGKDWAILREEPQQLLTLLRIFELSLLPCSWYLAYLNHSSGRATSFIPVFKRNWKRHLLKCILKSKVMCWSHCRHAAEITAVGFGSHHSFCFQQSLPAGHCYVPHSW